MAFNSDTLAAIAKSGPLLFRPKNQLIKKFKKHHATLFTTSSSGVARLEIYENDKDFKSGYYSLLIPGSEVVSVRDNYRPQTSDEKFGFIIATKEQQHHFCADSREDEEEWVKKTMETLIQPFVNAGSVRQSTNFVTEVDNDIYESVEQYKKDYRVTAGAETRQRLKVDGDIRLVIESGNITLISLDGNRIARWGIEHLRRFGYNENDFHIEAGRKSDHGVGTFSFVTMEGKQIHACVTQEKRVCRKNKNAEFTGAKAKHPGIITGTGAMETDEPLISLRGHVYEDVSIISPRAHKNEDRVYTNTLNRPAPDKPARANHFKKNDSESSILDSSPSFPPLAGGSTLPRVKQHPTHAKNLPMTPYQPAKDVLPAISKSPVKKSVPVEYDEVVIHNEAWKTYGRGTYEQVESFEGVYDTLHSMTTPASAPEESNYGRIPNRNMAPGILFEASQQREKYEQSVVVKPSVSAKPISSFQKDIPNKNIASARANKQQEDEESSEEEEESDDIKPNEPIYACVDMTKKKPKNKS